MEAELVRQMTLGAASRLMHDYPPAASRSHIPKKTSRIFERKTDYAFWTW
jgi:hypothetical protein